MRIALIHALAHSLAPIEASFARLWPEPTLMNLLDDSLSADLARDGKLTEPMTERFLSLGRYVSATGANAVLFTCSAFGPCIEAVARTHASMPREFPSSVEIVPKLAEGALAALNRGDRASHDLLVTEASRDLRNCDVIALAQFSMAPAAAMVAEATGRPVLTTPDSAVLKLKSALTSAAA